MPSKTGKRRGRGTHYGMRHLGHLYFPTLTLQIPQTPDLDAFAVEAGSVELRFFEFVGMAGVFESGDVSPMFAMPSSGRVSGSAGLGISIGDCESYNCEYSNDKPSKS